MRQECFEINANGCEMPKITQLSVSFLSLVKTPATGKGLVLKSDSVPEGSRVNQFEFVIKNDDLMRAYGIVYAPNQEDSQGDITDADTIRRAATEFMREKRLENIDTEHSFSTEMAFVAESWLVRKGDALFPSEPIGSWAVGIQVGDPELWRQLKTGALTGISLAGAAQVIPDEDDDPTRHTYATKDDQNLIGRVIEAIKSTFQTPKEIIMEKIEVEKIVQDTLKSALPDAIKQAMKSQDDTQTEVQKAVETALKAAGVAPKAGDNLDDDTKAAIKSMVNDAITTALAKGDVEDGGAGGVETGSFV